MYLVSFQHCPAECKVGPKLLTKKRPKFSDRVSHHVDTLLGCLTAVLDVLDFNVLWQKYLTHTHTQTQTHTHTYNCLAANSVQMKFTLL